MAQLITRQDQAERSLLPKGWAWAKDVDNGTKWTPKLTSGREAYYDQNQRLRERAANQWTWGVMNMDRTLTLESRAEAYKNMCEMLIEHYVHVRIAGWNTSGTTRLPISIQVMPLVDKSFQAYAADYGISPDDKPAVYDKIMQGWDTSVNVRGWKMTDGHKIGPGEMLRDGVALVCNRCHRVYPNLATNPDNTAEHYCSHCVRQCPGLDEPCSVPMFDTRFAGCEKHFPRATCAGCNNVCEIARSMGEHNGVRYCKDCLNTICQRCSKIGVVDINGPVMDGHESYYVCSECKKAVMEWLKQDKDERIVLESKPSMLVMNSPQRPVRLCSIELEVVEGAKYILADLYNKGLTATSQCLRHWSNQPDFCYMENDSSIPEFPAGGEIIFSKIRLDDATSAQKLAEGIGVIRKHVKSGNAKVDLRTGTHVHVDFHKSGFNHARNVVVLHNYKEDILYRLGAANYSRHRGTHYAMVLPKSGIDTQEEFNRYFFHRGNHEQMHHSVLNVDGFYRAAANCTCGHLVGETPEKCDCSLGKCTVEFRVFNGTSSWRKLHAYVALCQSLVAYARAHNDLAVDDFPPLLYNPVGVIDNDLKHAWIERLTWMFKNLWFSDEERASLNYCIEHSDLASLSYAQRKALRDITYVGEKYVNKKSPAKPAPSPYEHLKRGGMANRHRSAYRNAAGRPVFIDGPPQFITTNATPEWR